MKSSTATSSSSRATVAIVAIASLAYADSWLAYHHRRMERLLEGKPTIVVRDGDSSAAACAASG